MIKDVDTQMLKIKIFKIGDKAKLINYYLRWLHEGGNNPLYGALKTKDDGTIASDKIFEKIYPLLVGAKNDLDIKIKEIEEILKENFNIS